MFTCLTHVHFNNMTPGGAAPGSIHVTSMLLPRSTRAAAQRVQLHTVSSYNSISLTSYRLRIQINTSNK